MQFSLKYLEVRQGLRPFLLMLADKLSQSVGGRTLQNIVTMIYFHRVASSQTGFMHIPVLHG
jgi:hypothetical protein